MKRMVIAGIAALVTVSATAVMLLTREDPAPLPTPAEIRTHGFAVWPEDTLDEGIRACARAEEWQYDSRETALRFASEVLNYPAPEYNADPVDDPRSASYLIGDKEVPGVFLGSMVNVKKYGDCWFVVRVEPREDAWFPSVAFARDEEETQLVIEPTGAYMQVGYGSWEHDITDHDKQAVINLPHLEPDATGHVMAFGRSQKVLNGTAAPLGSVPEPATSGTSHVSMKKVVATPRVCRLGDRFRSPQAALAMEYTFTFNRAVSTRGKHIIFKKGDGAENVRGDRWLLRVGDTELGARIAKLRRGCWRVLSFDDDPRHRLLESLHVEPNRMTFDLNWGDATSGELVVTTTRGGASWSFEKIDRPLTVRNYEAWLLDEPMMVTVVLHDGRTVIAAERTWRSPE